ncbi:hypothetical protein DFJ73DRAFT_193343 [Zopfochytrium polystomum]|nr:hypothetical protein DFJ73DRAFT_193343 [Zopfochytrium polystomum]
MTIHKKCIALVENAPCTAIFSDKKIQGSFFKVFTSLLKNYRSFLVIPDALKERNRLDKSLVAEDSAAATSTLGMDLVQDDWFRKEDFLKTVDRDSKAFLSQLVETQAFSQFTLERIERPESDYEVLFFDESIKAKLNRSRLKFSKETTPFLRDGAYLIRSTVAAAAPNVEDLDLSGYRRTSARGIRGRVTTDMKNARSPPVVPGPNSPLVLTGTANSPFRICRPLPPFHHTQTSQVVFNGLFPDNFGPFTAGRATHTGAAFDKVRPADDAVPHQRDREQGSHRDGAETEARLYSMDADEAEALSKARRRGARCAGIPVGGAAPRAV